VTLGISNTSSFNSSAYFTWKIETTLGGSLEVTTDTSSQTPASSGTVVTPGTSQSASTIVRADLGENVIFHYPQNNSSSAVTHTISCTETTTSARATINVIVPAKPAEQTKYFWYAGQTKPTSMTSNPTPDDTTTPPTNNNWHTLAKDATSIAKTVVGGTSGKAWYIAVPTSFGFKPTASDLVTPNNTWLTEGTITVNNVEYTLWKPSGTSGRQAVYMAKI
jgi:hypothetical protein